MNILFDLVGKIFTTVKISETVDMVTVELITETDIFSFSYSRQDVTLRGAFHQLLNSPITFVSTSMTFDEIGNVYGYIITNSNVKLELFAAGVEIKINKQPIYFLKMSKNEF